jgi:hypothetical protein
MENVTTSAQVDHKSKNPVKKVVEVAARQAPEIHHQLRQLERPLPVLMSFRIQFRDAPAPVSPRPL